MDKIETLFDMMVKEPQKNFVKERIFDWNDVVDRVIDMNNNTNQIEGIGLLRNLPFMDKYYPIYMEGNYNRFVYKSEYHIDRELLLRNNHILVIVLDYLLFKEKNHMKRGCGFTTITQKIINGKTNPKYKLLDINKISQAIKDCFNRVYDKAVNS